MDNWTRLLISLEAKESPLLPDPRYTRSEHTKPPAPYHQHLSPNLVPRYAKVLEDLAGNLVEEAKDKIQRMRERDKGEPRNQLVDTGPSVWRQVKTVIGCVYHSLAYTNLVYASGTRNVPGLGATLLLPWDYMMGFGIGVC